MIDTHCHIVYGVDDGSRSIDESMKMVETYIKNGFEATIATSHFDRSRYVVDPDEIRDKVEAINAECKRLGYDFTLYPGHEIQVEANTVRLISNGKLNTLADSRYILFELPFMNEPMFLKDLIYQAQLEGYVPIIAHAERYAYVIKNVDYLLEFINMGALIQVNYSSMKSHKDTTVELLSRNMVHFLGTDAHQSEWRSPDIGAYKDAIIEIIGKDKFHDLSCTNPRKIIEDDYIAPAYGEIKKKEKKKKSIFNFWRRR